MKQHLRQSASWEPALQPDTQPELPPHAMPGGNSRDKTRSGGFEKAGGIGIGCVENIRKTVSIFEMRLEDVFRFLNASRKDRSLKEDVMIRNTEEPGYSQNIQVLHTLSPVFLDRRIEFSCNIYIIMAQNICN